MRPTTPPVAAVDDVDSAAADFVARIVRHDERHHLGRSPCQVRLHVSLSADETIRVTTGLVKLEFYSGATVILQAPAVFTPTGPDSGRLDRGRLTGRAAHGNFHLTTAAADVIDLGTEFGVSVDDLAVTDVVVFDGEVEVVSLAAGWYGGRSVENDRGDVRPFYPCRRHGARLSRDPEDFLRSCRRKETRSMTN